MPELPPKMTKICGTTKLHCNTRSQRDACLSSRDQTMSLPSLFGALPRSRAYTVARLRRLLQMGAASGWLQPQMDGPLVLSSGCWEHDGFQMLSGLSDVPTLTTMCRCQAATEHRINIAHLVLHPIWTGELSSGQGQRTKDKGQHSLEMRPTQVGHLAPVGVSGRAMAPRGIPDLTSHAQLAKQSTTQHC